MTITRISSAEIRHEHFSIVVDGIHVKIAIAHREGALTPILFLHGFGGSKEDYLNIALHDSFRDRPFIAFDAPGCGETRLEDFSKMSIPFLVKATEEVLRELNVQQFHLVGHSMGGLTGLELAARHPEAVLSFTNIKGNLGPEDCFLSRQIFTWPEEEPEKFLARFIQRNYQSPLFSAALYASNVHSKVQAEAIRGIFESMVKLSDEGGLLAKFLSLPFPRMFMYGEQYKMLSYLPILEEHDVQLAEIAHCGHFPMYSNPVAMWDALSQFIESV